MTMRRSVLPLAIIFVAMTMAAAHGYIGALTATTAPVENARQLPPYAQVKRTRLMPVFIVELGKGKRDNRE